MRTYLFLLIFLWWLLLLLTFAPALIVGLLCGWKMAGMTWQKGLAAGLAGGFVGMACSIVLVLVHLPDTRKRCGCRRVLHAAHSQRRQRLGHLPPLAAPFARLVVVA